MSKLEVGKIINTHGLRGEVKVISWTDSPEDFENIKSVYAHIKSDEQLLHINGIKYQKNNLIIKFKEIDSIDSAEQYKNAILSADRSELPPLPEGSHYIADLIGCEIYNAENEKIGVLSDVFPAGGRDVYEIKRDGLKPLLLSVSDETVKNIDTDNKKITVCLPEEWND